MLRKLVAAWSVVAVVFAGAFFPVRDVYAVTIPTRLVNGTHIYSPSAGTELVDIIAGVLGRANPWITAVGVGITLARFIVQTQDGSIAVSSRGQAMIDAAAHPISTPPPTTTYSVNSPVCTSHNCATFTNQLVQASSQQAACNAAIAPYNGSLAGVGNTIAASGWASAAYQPYGICVMTYSGGAGTSNLTESFACPSGEHGVTPDSCGWDVPASAVGGTQTWSPRAMVMPDGSSQMGWESPSDPSLQPQTITPSDTFTYPAVNGVSPQVQFTPNPDGGVTTQTWSPEFLDSAHPTTQTGWTVQTTTINYAGNVTTSTVVINNAAPPPTAIAPTTNATTPLPVTPVGTPVSAQPVVCGSLDCESTQQGIHTDTSGIHTDTTGIHTDTTGIHTDTTALLSELQGNGAGQPPNLTTAASDAAAADKGKSDAAIAQLQAEGVAAVAHDNPGIYGNWLWTPPVGTCTAPTATLGLAHTTVTWDYCPMVDSIRTVIGWLLALFASWHIWNLMMAKDPE